MKSVAMVTLARTTNEEEVTATIGSMAAKGTISAAAEDAGTVTTAESEGEIMVGVAADVVTATTTTAQTAKIGRRPSSREELPTTSPGSKSSTIMTPSRSSEVKEKKESGRKR